MAAGQADRRRSTALRAVSAAAVVLAAVLVVYLRSEGAFRQFVGRASSLPACPSPRELERIAAGHRDGRSEDIKLVPRDKNYLGSFNVVSHSGPKDYLQRVPLVLFGSGIESTSSDRIASVADVYPSIGSLLGVELEPRGGRVLTEAITGDHPVPRLVVVVVWDGAGQNVLDRWPQAWPNLASLVARGAVLDRAVVGSSPSITPSIHSTLGTGSFPSDHGVTGIQYRVDADTIGSAFTGRDPAVLLQSTFAYQVDQAFDNRSKVGMIGWRSWQMGMLGHGSSLPGGDRDDLAIIDHRGRITGKRPYFRVPAYLHGAESLLGPHLDRADASDGQIDGDWRGHPVEADQDNPGWVEYQSELLTALIEQGGYGADEVPDILLANFKTTDRVGHLYNMESDEMEEVLAAQDAALGELVALLDSRVGEYTLVMTADHGHTPSPEVSGAWPINQQELEDDLDQHLGVPAPTTIAQATTGVGVFLDREVMDAYDVTQREIVRFLDAYSIGQNWRGDRLPAGYEDRADERLFESVFAAPDLPELMTRCALQGDSPGL
ncbi:MAG: alkaline phosphatase family protein [Actinobacteria bacterium]|nr:alkaline phosphatase family protein [Actinomycetota bacterium]